MRKCHLAVWFMRASVTLILREHLINFPRGLRRTARVFDDLSEQTSLCVRCVRSVPRSIGSIYPIVRKQLVTFALVSLHPAKGYIVGYRIGDFTFYHVIARQYSYCVTQSLDRKGLDGACAQFRISKFAKRYAQKLFEVNEKLYSDKYVKK